MRFNPERLKQARLHAGLTQAELARRTGKATEQINKWERGKYQPRVETVSALARALNIEVSYLVRDEEQEHLETEEELETEVLAALRRWLIKRQARRGRVAA